MLVVHTFQNLLQASSRTLLQAMYIIKTFSESTCFNAYAKYKHIFIKFGLHLQVYMMSQLRRLEPKQLQPKKSQNYKIYFTFTRIKYNFSFPVLEQAYRVIFHHFVDIKTSDTSDAPSVILLG
jgi:hypothetical protein